MKFAEWLEQKLKDTGMSQSDLARELEITRAAVNNMLSGKTQSPSIETMLKLAVIFQVPIEQVYKAAGVPLSRSQIEEIDEEIQYVLSQMSPGAKKMALELLKTFSKNSSRGKVKVGKAKANV